MFRKICLTALLLICSTAQAYYPGSKQPVSDAGPKWMYEQASDPTAQADRGVLYTKDSSGVSLLYYEDSAGTVTNLVGISGRTVGRQGSDVTAANDTTLTQGNYFDITGSTTINGIATSGWTAGSTVILQFDAAPLVKNNTTASTGFASFKLAGGADFQASADDTLMLVFDGTFFRELSRSAN